MSRYFISVPVGLQGPDTVQCGSSVLQLAVFFLSPPPLHPAPPIPPNPTAAFFFYPPRLSRPLGPRPTACLVGVHACSPAPRRD